MTEVGGHPALILRAWTGRLLAFLSYAPLVVLLASDIFLDGEAPGSLDAGLMDAIPFSIGPADVSMVGELASGVGDGGKAAPIRLSMTTAPPPKVISALRRVRRDLGPSCCLSSGT
ncbi:hypothetical protein GCM10023075_37970 [Streptosporangium album]